MNELFANPGRSPLAERIRPEQFAQVQGLSEQLKRPGPLRAWVERSEPSSLILWGPPGVGKTTVARLLLEGFDGACHQVSAVLGSLKETREILKEAEQRFRMTAKATALFVDEIHRFHRGQQDAFLPHLERGDVILVGATTENPSYHLNDALLSRAPVVQLNPLPPEALTEVLRRALKEDQQMAEVEATEEGLHYLALQSGGDCRLALSWLELAAENGLSPLTPESAAPLVEGRSTPSDRQGEAHHSRVSALHKSIRNSDVQAALYWLGLMLDGGEDPLYIARRLVRAASEDIGLADPKALEQALLAKETVAFIGMPEGDLALAQATAYMALAPKSNAIYMAMKGVKKDLADGQRHEPPLHLRNATNKWNRGWGYGDGYQYAHDEADMRSDMDCLPDALKDRVYYTPKDTGFEKKLGEWMALWRKRRSEEGES